MQSFPAYQDHALHYSISAALQHDVIWKLSLDQTGRVIEPFWHYQPIPVNSNEIISSNLYNKE